MKSESLIRKCRISVTIPRICLSESLQTASETLPGLIRATASPEPRRRIVQTVSALSPIVQTMSAQLTDKRDRRPESEKDSSGQIHVQIASSNHGKAWKEFVPHSRRVSRLVVRIPRCAARSPSKVAVISALTVRAAVRRAASSSSAMPPIKPPYSSGGSFKIVFLLNVFFTRPR